MKNRPLLLSLLICFFTLTATLIAQNAPTPANPTANSPATAQTNLLANSFANALANKTESQQSTSWDTLSKNIVLNKNSAPLTLRLDNLAEQDIVNVVAQPLNNKDADPKASTSSDRNESPDNSVLFQASTYFLTGDPAKQTLFEVLGLGTAPPESALHLAANYIYFSRPQSLTGNLIVHIQVPPQTTVKLVINDKTVVNSQLAQPVAWRKGAIGKGENHKFAALVKTLKPNIRVLPPDTAFVRIEHLKLRQRTPINVKEGTLIAAQLSISPAGRVTEVRIVYGEATEELKNSLYKWEFEPHLVNGKAVPVETTMAIKH